MRLKSQFRLARWVRQINPKVVVTVSGEREGEEEDATLWSHRPLSVLPEVYRLRASVRLGHLYLVGSILICLIMSLALAMGSAVATTPHHTTPHHTTPHHTTPHHTTPHHTTPHHTTAQHATPQRSIAQHSTAQRSTAQHSAAERSRAQHNAAQRITTQHDAAQRSKTHTTPHNTTEHAQHAQHAQHATYSTTPHLTIRCHTLTFLLPPFFFDPFNLLTLLPFYPFNPFTLLPFYPVPHYTEHTYTHNTQHTTHNTQHTTHNIQHTTDPPFRLLPPSAVPLKPDQRMGTIRQSIYKIEQATLGRSKLHESDPTAFVHGRRGLERRSTWPLWERGTGKSSMPVEIAAAINISDGGCASIECDVRQHHGRDPCCVKG